MKRTWGWVLASASVVGCFLGDSNSLRFTRSNDASTSPDAAGNGISENDFTDASIDASTAGSILPTFPPTTTNATAPPPPISGGTLLVTSDGKRAVATDPDRDHVYGVDLASKTIVFDTALYAGDEPGRVAEDGSGRVHVALRSGGALVTIDEASGAILARRDACPAPRGVAWDASSDLVWVACATGELVAFPSSGGSATQRFVVERDLRDVVVQNGALSVTSFRSAEILRLATGAKVARRDAMPKATTTALMNPHVAWRAAPRPDGSIVVVHQVESTGFLSTASQGGYGGGCGNIEPPLPDSQIDDGGAIVVTTCGKDVGLNFTGAPCAQLPGAVVSALTIVAPDGSIVSNRMFPAALPVDVAVSRDGAHLAVVAAGNGFAKLGSVSTFSACGDLDAPAAPIGNDETPIAVAYDMQDHLIVQTREPSKLWVDGTPIALSTTSRENTGHDVFHAQAGVMIACASCHPEGGDDGHVWNLDGNPRRTPSLRGTIAGTAPYHWPGDQPTFTALALDVYTKRMAGALLQPDQTNALEQFVDGIPAPKSPTWIDAGAAARGRAIFEDANVGCASCHSGEKFTNNATVDVGTGGAFQVPPLVGVGWRTPLLHDGCAATILDRFGACATPGHGQIGALTPANVSDLATYLETL
jgi:mono/diheme cytochrome c family protein